MNATIGSVLVAVGLAAALVAFVNQIYGLTTKRQHLLRRVRIPVLLMFLAALGQYL